MKVEYYSHRGGYNGTTRKAGYRLRNEDTILIEELQTPTGESLLVAVVCDGMGGGVDGKFASSKVCDDIRNALESAEVPQSNVLAFVQNVIYRSVQNSNIYIYNKYAGQKPSATTCTAVVTDGKVYRVLHIGDSRLYVLGDDLTQITVDDTWVQREINAGRLTLEEARKHKSRHVITKAVGATKVFQPWVSQELPFDGDLLLTSDGFSELLTPAKAQLLKSSEGELENMAQLMINEGQKDNISAIIVRRG